MNQVQRIIKASKTSSMEFTLSDLMEDVEARIKDLDPEVSEEESEINQLWLMWNHLNDAHSELMKYIREY